MYVIILYLYTVYILISAYSCIIMFYEPRVKGEFYPNTKIQSLYIHPPANRKWGEVSWSTLNILEPHSKTVL